ncbi:MAG: T9SS type A sorting domain-containing protein [Candidatus Kapaibacterium sp.]|nr:T9SS type A sorting domain-containing protein [Bacteroidota bacterium]
MKISVVLFVLCITVVYSSSATMYYVSESLGNDAWSGMLPEPNINRTDGPKKSMSAANDILNTIARGGDNVLFRRGDVWQTGLELQSAKGEPDNYIVIGAYGLGDNPVIRKNTAGQGILCRGSATNGTSYIRFEYLNLTTTLTQDKPTGVNVSESFYQNKPHHILFNNITITNCKNGMILYEHHITVERCTLRLNGNDNQGHGIFVRADSVLFSQNVLDSNGCGSYFVHSIYVSNCNGIRIEQNEILRADDGIKLRASDNVAVLYNRIHDMHVHAIHAGGDDSKGSANVRIEGNVVLNSPQSFTLGSESGTQTAVSSNFIIANNIFTSLVHLSGNGPIQNVVFCNNVLYNGLHSQLFASSAINPIQLRVLNNIFYRTQSSSQQTLVSLVSPSGVSGLELNNNLYYSGTTVARLLSVGSQHFTSLSDFRTTYAQHEQFGVYGNPNFVSDSDFHLTALSGIAIDKGADVSEFINADADATSRPYDGDAKNGAQFDIGAYEFTQLVSVSNQDEHLFTLYPNPTSGELYVQGVSGTIEMYSLLGELVYLDVTSTTSERRIPTEHLPSGMYRVVCTQGKHRVSKAIIVQH